MATYLFANDTNIILTFNLAECTTIHVITPVEKFGNLKSSTVKTLEMQHYCSSLLIKIPTDVEVCKNFLDIVQIRLIQLKYRSLYEFQKNMF